MRHIFEHCSESRVPDDYLELNFEARQKSRLRARAISGDEVGLILERGAPLKDRDSLRAEDGRVYGVIAQAEPVSVALAPDAQQLARVAYHLGNRHVKLQIGSNFVRYERDHVLDDMVRKLGFTVSHEVEPFEPEPGAYDRSHAHSHGDGHSHEHGHAHSHSHAAGHSHSHGSSHAHSHSSHAHVDRDGHPYEHVQLSLMEPGALLFKTP